MTVSAQSVSHKLNHCSSVRYHLEFASQWLQDSAVTEICVNRPFEIWCERQGIWEKHSDSQLSLAYLHSLATAVAKFSDNNISDTCPILSATLPDGERVQIVVPTACENNTVAVTIRKPSLKLHYLADYQNQGFFAHIRPVVEELTADERELIQLKEQGDYCNFLKRAVQLEKVIVVAGETGSGNTTFMKALLQEISCQQRIITIEDVPELFLPNHPNHVHLFYPSEAKEEENASVTASTLLKSCLRMKPSRILLAELRGGETFDFINVAASGHGGSITSCHAGSAALTFERLALMILQNRQGRTLSHSVIQRLLYLVVDVIVHIHNSPLEGYGRHITEVWFDPMKKRSSELTL